MRLFNRKEFTKHDWHLIDTQVLPSMIEQIGPTGHYQGYGVSQKTVIQTFKCKLTNEVKIVKHLSGTMDKPRVTKL